MRVAGIVCEYNPFHNGHRLHIEATRRAGYTHIAAVMSPHVTQRGELALFDKWSRAAAAVRCGADLVLELPTPYAAASAEYFAAAAVALLAALGVVEAVSFGSESGDAEMLRQAADYLDTPEAHARIRQSLSAGVSYPAARQSALDAIGVRLTDPNDILGVEYCKAIRAEGRLRPLAVRRMGCRHDGAPDGSIASASYLRARFRAAGAQALAPYVPADAMELYAAALAADPNRIDRVLLDRLRALSPDAFAALPDAAEGLHHRLYRCARQAVSMEALAMAAKTKRYTLSRIRRMLLCAALGVTAADRVQPPPYLRVLAANARGREILSAADGRSALPVSASLARLRQHSPAAARTAALEAAVTDLFTLATEEILPCGLDSTRKAYII